MEVVVLKRPLEEFPVFPHCADDFLTDLNIEAYGAHDLTNDHSDAAPLAVRVRDFSKCVGRLDEVLELQALSADLRSRPFLVCERVDDNGRLGAHWEDVALPGRLSDEPSPLITISAANPYPVVHLSRLDVLLHETAHLEFQKHDILFAALLNWQRLRCGLPLLSDPYDVQQQREFRPSEGLDGAEAALKLAHEIATMFSRVGSRKLVAGALKRLESEKDRYADGDAPSLRTRALKMATMVEQSCDEP
jgi:hypothetical protein